MQLERDRGAELERRAATALASHEQEVQAAVEATAAAEAKAAEAIRAARTAVEGRQLAEAWAAELQVRGTKMGIRMGIGHVDVG
jgi:hypothetical protein